MEDLECPCDVHPVQLHFSTWVVRARSARNSLSSFTYLIALTRATYVTQISLIQPRIILSHHSMLTHNNTTRIFLNINTRTPRSNTGTQWTTKQRLFISRIQFSLARRRRLTSRVASFARINRKSRASTRNPN